MNPAPFTLEITQDAPAVDHSWVSECGRVTLYLGDSVELRHLVPADAAIISDPPYGMKLDTDNSRFSGGNTASVARRGNGIGTGKGKGIINDEKPFDPSPWLAWEKVVHFGSNHFGARLPVGTKLIWIKRLDDAFGSFLSDAEEAWMKGGHGIYCKRDLSMTGEALTRQHPCQKPVPLMAWCMDKAKVPAGAVVVDPYMGSGSQSSRPSARDGKRLDSSKTRNTSQTPCNESPTNSPRGIYSYNTFPAPSGAGNNRPVAMWPALPSAILGELLGGKAAGRSI